METLSSVPNSSVSQLDNTEHDRPTFPSLRDTDINTAMVIQEREVNLSSTEKPSAASKDSKVWQDWKIFATTFITIFLAELGDKTQVSILLMSAESHAPWVVFTGAAAALITTSLLGVLVGRWLSCHLSPKVLDRAAGIILALISIALFWDILH